MSDSQGPMPSPATAPPPACRVCQADTVQPFWRSREGADYWRCHRCEATFLDASQLPSREAEFRRYSQHQNSTGDTGYAAFLNLLATPLLARLPAQQHGLDYGCGPGPAPVLAAALRAAGHTVRLYDPFFHPEPDALAQTYDFITCTEVVEHFHRPAEEFCRLDGCLRPGGWLAIMTCLQTDDRSFADWYYRRDLTHVTFYREATFRWLAVRFAWHCEMPCKNVVLMQKTATPINATCNSPLRHCS